MKSGKKARKKWAAQGENPSEIFLRGFVAAGLLTAIRDRLDPEEPNATARKVLRHALQGGCALTAATLTARALSRNQYGPAILAAGLGAAGLMAAEQALRPVAAEAPAFTEETNLVEEEEE